MSLKGMSHLSATLEVSSVQDRVYIQRADSGSFFGILLEVRNLGRNFLFA
jgi:hypothetical protein